MIYKFLENKLKIVEKKQKNFFKKIYIEERLQSEEYLNQKTPK